MQSKQERKKNLALIEKLKSDAKKLQKELKEQAKTKEAQEELKRRQTMEQEIKLRERKQELQQMMANKEELVGTSFTLEDIVVLMSNSDNIQQSIDLAYYKEANQRFYIKDMEKSYKCSLVKIGKEYIVEHIEIPKFCVEVEEVEIFSPGEYTLLEVIGIENWIRYNPRLEEYATQVCNRIAYNNGMDWEQLENGKIRFYRN